MRKSSRFLLLLVAAAASLALSAASRQTPPADPSAVVVDEWFDAVNALDGSDESVARLLGLYHADALHIQGPTGKHQLGTVTFDGAAAVETMARQLFEGYEHIQYRIEMVTANEASKRLFHHAEGPWGGESVAVQFWAARTRRADGLRFAQPGAAFFQLEAGRIRRLRLYLADGERSEVEPDR